MIHCFIQRICQRQCRSTRCIAFQSVMLFHNLHIKSGCSQYLCCILKQLQQRVNPQRHIGRFENRYFLAAFFHLRQLFLCQACGTQNKWKLSLYTVIQYTICCFKRRKINHDICFHIAGFDISKYRISVITVICHIDSCHDLCIFIFCD